MITEEQFMAKVRKTRTCWLWQGSKHKKTGYGTCRGASNTEVAHRMSYRLFVKEPGSLYVLHKCDVKLCVRPSHLFLGTQKDNIQDAKKKGRLADWKKLPPRNYNKGTKCRHSKLKESDIPLIRKRYKEIGVYGRVAKEFGVTGAAIRLIIIGRNWKSISGGDLSISS